MRILVVEDEILFAEELAHTLREVGADVIGSAPTVSRALALIRSSPAFDAAVIDVYLAGEVAYPVVEALIALNRPFVFATACRPDDLPEAYRNAPRCAKPTQAPLLLNELRRALAGAALHVSSPAETPSEPVAMIDRSYGLRTPSPLESRQASSVTDEDDAGGLIRKIAAGDKESFGRLFLQFAPRVKRYMLTLQSDPALAEELTQEALLTVWRKAHLFDARNGTSEGWIFTIARNLRIDAARRQRLQEGTEDSKVPKACEPNPEETLLSQERLALVGAALSRLSPAQSQVLRASLLRDAPVSKIAEDLGLPLSTAKSHLRRGLAKLREVLGESR